MVFTGFHQFHSMYVPSLLNLILKSGTKISFDFCRKQSGAKSGLLYVKAAKPSADKARRKGKIVQLELRPFR
jgi:hypothetical protein